MRQAFSYKVKYFAGGRTTRHPYRAMITFHGTSEYPEGLMTTGVALFHRVPATMPTEDHRDSNGYIQCHLRWEDFPAVIDLLRNEAPVYVGYSDESRMAFLTTLEESVGEGEGDVS